LEIYCTVITTSYSVSLPFEAKLDATGIEIFNLSWNCHRLLFRMPFTSSTYSLFSLHIDGIDFQLFRFLDSIFHVYSCHCQMVIVPVRTVARMVNITY